MKRIIVSLLFTISTAVLAFSQEAQNTKNSADQMLRSNGAVNPSTLGLEMSIPLGGYQGRGITLPIGLNYSSKLWRFGAEAIWVTPYCFTCGLATSGETWTFVSAKYAEDSASGWTSSISQPYVEYTGKYTSFNGIGTPIVEYFIQGSTRPPPPGPYYVKRMTVHLPDASYELREGDAPIQANPLTASWNGIYKSTDGSGAKYIEDDTVSPHIYRLYLADGSFYDFGQSLEQKSSTDVQDIRRAAKLTDPSGNYITFNPPPNPPNGTYPNGSITDTLGRTFPVVVPREAPAIPENDDHLDQSFAPPGISEYTPYVFTWKRLGDSFADANYVLHYKGTASNDFTNPPQLDGPSLFYTSDSMSPCTSDQLRVFADFGDRGPILFNPAVLTHITLPNGAVYEFSYNEFGEVERINYPTGGHEKYVYGARPSLAQLSKPYQISNRAVVERNVYENDNATPSTWTYTADSSKNRYRTTVTAPDGIRTERFMLRGEPPTQCGTHNPGEWPTNDGLWWGYDNVLAGRPYEERIFSSSYPYPIVQQTLTKWDRAESAVTNLWMTVNPQRHPQLNPRMIWTDSITYDGDAGVAAATRLEYYSGDNVLGSPLNVQYKKEYAYRPVTGGSTILFNQTLPDTEPSLTDPTASPTPVRVTNTIYNTDSAYLNRNFLRLSTDVLVTDGASPANVKAKSQIIYDESTYLVSDYVTGTVPGWGTPLASPSPVVRGLATTTKSWYDVNTSNAYVQTRVQYNQFGSPRITTDANGNTSEVIYTDNFSDNTDRHTYAYPTETVSAIPYGNGSTSAFHTHTKYEFGPGLPVSVIDINGQTTAMEYVDPLRRPTKVIAPNNAETITEYGLGTSASTRWVKVKSQIDASAWKEGRTWYDGLMRNVRTQSVDDDGDLFTLTCYDNMARVSKASNPFRGYSSQDCSTTSGMEWTTNTFDTAGRPWKITTPDDAVVTTTYGVAASSGYLFGTVVTIADQAGKLRRSVTNALGQLKRVDEPNGSNVLGELTGPNQHTDYAYDLLSNLTNVTQGDQTRTFTYDALSRLQTGANPEAGTISYAYDSNGNLTQKDDPRGVRTAYVYDAINRVTNRNYTTPSGTPPYYQASPNVTYYYDNVTNAKGKLTKTTSSASTTEYTTFDISGRVTGHKQTTDGTDYTTGYTYNLAGGLVDETYPSTRVVRNVLDGNGDLAVIESKKNSNGGFWQYASTISYSPSGSVTSLQLGNGHWENTTFNSRLQPLQIALGTTPAATNLLKLDYTYGTTVNNGNVLTQTITVPTVGTNNGFTANQTYTYDSLNRVNDATETVTGVSGNAWKQTFTYDRYGNRRFDFSNNNTTVPASNCVQAVCNPTFESSTNKFASGQTWAYDSSGNVRTDANSSTFIYDGENKQVELKNSSSVTLGQYFYDGDGKRVKKITGDEVTIFVYDATGKFIAEYSTAVASIENAKVAYLTSDHLGSSRINTDANGAVTSRHDYHPFGEEVVTSQRTTHPDYAGDPIRKKFTGYERDSESGLDFAKARYYASNLGRFVSPDWAAKPEAVPYAQLDNPQSLNLYVYALNNPLSKNDPDGHLAWPWHFFITFAAGMRTHHGFFHSLKLGWKNAAVDFRKGSQGTDAAHTNMHAMAGKNPDNTVQSAADARAATAQIVTTAVHNGDTAVAGHAAIDAATPDHDGKLWKGFHLNGETIKHILDDFLPKPGTVRQAYENEKSVLQGTNPLAPAQPPAQSPTQAPAQAPATQPPPPPPPPPPAPEPPKPDIDP